MKLLNTQTLRIQELSENDLKTLEDDLKSLKYAILSHTWLRNGEEISYQDMVSNTDDHRSKTGYAKIEFCCRQAVSDEIEWVWIDTCCIDHKGSYDELPTALNSMWKWYGRAHKCYAYLVDVIGSLKGSPGLAKAIKASRYFERAWTLQELIAPQEVTFYAEDWTNIGSRDFWKSTISDFTGIHEKALEGDVSVLKNFSLAQKMSWASKRVSSKPEDIAYCLVGIFDVAMAYIPAEGGPKAFIRLQEEIMKKTDDQTLFAWEPEEISSAMATPSGPLAYHPKFFQNSRDICKIPRDGKSSSPFSMTNAGLRITLPLAPLPDSENLFVADLVNCYRLGKNGKELPLGMRLQKFHKEGDQYARYMEPLTKDIAKRRKCFKDCTIYMRQEVTPSHEVTTPHPGRVTAFKILPPHSHTTEIELFSAPDSSTWSERDGLDWQVVSLLKEIRLPDRPFKVPGHFFLVLGYDGTSGEAWCEVSPFPQEAQKPGILEEKKRICEEVQSGDGKVGTRFSSQ